MITGTNWAGRPVVLRYRYGGGFVRPGDRVTGAAWSGVITEFGHRPPEEPGSAGRVSVNLDAKDLEASISVMAADMYWAPQSRCDF